MLPLTAEHAVRALLYLARRAGDGPVPVEAIATGLGAPRNYLSKTMQRLAQHGLVEGRRGPGGGFRLEVDPAELTVARIVEAVREPREPATCLAGDRPCCDRAPCELHYRWKAMWQASEAPLQRTTLSALLGNDAPHQAEDLPPATPEE
jgi:Rrf2 family iron-sulfur cluster assembly transcriptional regulator